MDSAAYTQAKTLQDDIAGITEQQGLLATSGIKAVVTVLDADGNVLCAPNILKNTLGGAYDTICSTALASLGTQLTSLKNSKESAFEAL